MDFTRPMQFQLPMMRGDDVRDIQQALAVLGIVPPCGNPDGVFGQQTASAVTAYQKRWNATRPGGAAPLATPGLVDAATFAAIVHDVASQPASVPHAFAGSATIPPGIGKDDLPITRAEAVRLKAWMMANFGDQVMAAIGGKPIPFDLVCAIAAKETACFWVDKVDRFKPADILRLCVFDASGESPTLPPRRAFPTDAAAMRASPYGGLVDPLIAAANEQRRVLRGLPPATYLYKGYGIFQYDLQHIRDGDAEHAFFAQQQWADMDKCLAHLVGLLEPRLAAAGDPGVAANVERAVAAYNGGGDAAIRYGKSVMVLYAWCQGAQ